MKFLLDEGLSPRVGGLLADAGHDAVHARDLGLSSSADPVMLQAAVDSHRVLLTLDADFGTLLARSGDSIRSVVTFRGNVTRCPERQAALLLANLDRLETTLTEGALGVSGDNRLGIRSFPIEPA